ncbi:methyltransferase, partial [Pseudomonas sp. MWU13-2860]
PALHKPMLQYVLHPGQQAEMVTDGLRALFLEACGKETKAFEFISLDHTKKNKMSLTVKRSEPGEPTQLLARIEELKAFYQISEHCLETLLKAYQQV